MRNATKSPEKQQQVKAFTSAGQTFGRMAELSASKEAQTHTHTQISDSSPNNVHLTQEETAPAGLLFQHNQCINDLNRFPLQFLFTFLLQSLLAAFQDGPFQLYHSFHPAFAAFQACAGALFYASKCDHMVSAARELADWGCAARSRSEMVAHSRYGPTQA